MTWSYRCPKCRALLNPEDTIYLVAQHGDFRVLAGFHPEPGNYEVWFPPEVALEDGQRWTFSCPVCHADLQSDQSENLCALELETGGGAEHVLFSRVAGEQATFVVRGGELAERHGRDAQTYFEHAMGYRIF